MECLGLLSVSLHLYLCGSHSVVKSSHSLGKVRSRGGDCCSSVGMAVCLLNSEMFFSSPSPARWPQTAQPTHMQPSRWEAQSRHPPRLARRKSLQSAGRMHRPPYLIPASPLRASLEAEVPSNSVRFHPGVWVSSLQTCFLWLQKFW